MSDTDLELLARYTRHHAEDAFSEVVRRHLDLVHSAALRQVRSPQLAEEVAQSTFIKLAHQAHRLTPDTILTAWLYQVTRREAIDVVRREARRQLREQIAVEMNAMNATADDWMQIEPLLDEAMHALDDTDRTAILLRYFERKPARAMAQTLGISDEAAQKRVSRAVERLREFFAKRGVTIGASGLIVVISANAVQAAPVGLVVSISGAVTALAGTTIATTASASAATSSFTTNFLEAMGTTKIKIVAAAVVAASVGTLFVMQHRTNHSLRAENATLREQGRQNMVLADLSADNQRLAEQLKIGREQSESERRELLRLRGEVTALRQAEQAGVRASAERDASTQLRLDGISFRGNSIFTDAQLANVLVSKVGEPMDARKLSQDQFGIYELYRKAGYDHISVRAIQDIESPPGQVTFLVGEMNQEAGIGVQVAYVKPRGALHIERVIPNSPAEKAGLSRGLYIDEIDGKPTRALTQGDCTMLLRGAVGTKVRLGIWDAEQKTNLTVEVTRQKLVL